jgi:alpha-mannosidase
MKRGPVAEVRIALLAFVLIWIQSAVAQEDRQPATKQARKWVVYLLPHSHIDIGYTHLQPEVERMQCQILDAALELCRKTAAYPPGAQFKWNAEVLWQVDGYLRQATPEKRRQLIEAVRAGQFELQACYGNELTGLCRPEELLRLMQWGIALGRQCGVKIDSAMIDDVTGCTWGIVPAMAQAGVKYLAAGTNCDHRIGRTLSTWEDKPFYWLAPDRRQKILCWIPLRGYGIGPGFNMARQLPDHLARLEKAGYPYDIVQLRWTRGDNQPPDAGLPDFVRDWNAKHDSPKLVIATAGEMFRDCERRYADKIPVVSGDFTPYWEDGAASSARETAINRASAERLVQAETIAAILGPQGYRAKPFWEAWRNVLLYDEHTWGGDQYNVVDYNIPFIADQWKIKQGFALDGDAQSRKLLATVLAGRTNGQPGEKGTGPICAKHPPGRSGKLDLSPFLREAIDVFNTSSWPRTDVVVLSGELSAAGDVVTDADGRTVPSQRLSSGELAFLAQNVPPLAGRRYAVGPGKAMADGRAKIEGVTLTTPTVSVRVDPVSGSIASFRSAAIDAELSDVKAGVGLNRYYYVAGNRVKEAQQAGPAKISVKERGPLAASLLVESAAPGCVQLSREIRVIDGLDRVDIVNTLDKKEIREKEGVHLGFAFNVPDGVMRIDIPWAVFRPEIDQLPGACKQWLCVGRWADVSNQQYGVTWATPDAPMIEVGAITADKLAQTPDPNLWLAKLNPSQTLYSYVMNNYWITNYRPFQSGPTMFRYSLLPHKKYDEAAAQRFGIERSQPLVAVPARGPAPSDRPFLELDTPDVIVASMKPSEDGQAFIVRLFGAGDRPAKAALRWAQTEPQKTWISNLAEERLAALTGPVDVPPRGLVTLRAE